MGLEKWVVGALLAHAVCVISPPHVPHAPPHANH